MIWLQTLRKMFSKIGEPLYNSRSEMSTFITRKVRATYHVLNSLTYLAPKIWNQELEAHKKKLKS